MQQVTPTGARLLSPPKPLQPLSRPAADVLRVARKYLVAEHLNMVTMHAGKEGVEKAAAVAAKPIDRLALRRDELKKLQENPAVANAYSCPRPPSSMTRWPPMTSRSNNHVIERNPNDR